MGEIDLFKNPYYLIEILLQYNSALIDFIRDIYLKLYCSKIIVIAYFESYDCVEILKPFMCVQTILLERIT